MAVSESELSWCVVSHDEGSFPLSAPWALGGRSLRGRPSLTGPVERVEVPPILLLHHTHSFSRPQLGRDDPLNLSILLRGGKENNNDSLSKGD